MTTKRAGKAYCERCAHMGEFVARDKISCRQYNKCTITGKTKSINFPIHCGMFEPKPLGDEEKQAAEFIDAYALWLKSKYIPKSVESSLSFLKNHVLVRFPLSTVISGDYTGVCDTIETKTVKRMFGRYTMRLNNFVNEVWLPKHGDNQ